MKAEVFKPSCTKLSLFIGLVLLLVGCKSDEPSSEEVLQQSIFSVAGFRAHTPKTSKQLDLYAALPSYQFQQGNANDKIFYVYRDDNQGVAYVGGEAEYQRYQELAVEQSISSDEYLAVHMDDEMAMGWHNAWAAGGFW